MSEKKQAKVVSESAKLIFTQIDNLSKLRNVDKSFIVNLFKEEILKTIYEDYDADAEIEFNFDEENASFTITNLNKTVVADPKSATEKDSVEPIIDVVYSEAIKENPNIKIGDTFAQEINFGNFPKSVYTRILQKFENEFKAIDKQKIFDEYSKKIGEVVKATVASKLKQGLLLKIADTVDAFMPPNAINKKLLDKLYLGQTIDVYIENVNSENKVAQVIVSSVEGKILEKLLHKEVPEISQGLIEVVSTARFPGERAKIVVKKTEKAGAGIEAAGSVIGENGSRIDAISRQLDGEKIDVIEYSSDIKELIMNALSPAKVIDIIEKPSKTNKYPNFIVIVPQVQHTLAIGGKGQNVSLASSVAKARLDILSDKEAREKGFVFAFNGNITEEEIKALESGRRLRANFKKGKQQPPQNYNTNIDLSNFDEDLQAIRESLNFDDKDFAKEFYAESDIDLHLEETLAKVKDEIEETKNDEIEDKDPYSNEKVKEDYEKIAKTKLKDFKKDDDLSADLDFDLSDIGDEEW
ncbi:NusA antitermination factor [Metamycoplasma subdolum]|uniref:Transcription termination/antitermination protein NusA n=1 Tax=Metamycoplasma subdolum TaxID=92407 RepID=A0A3L9ZXY2_9BACT|nr:transcription termination factor NusA [Metamycoplasma subdolum]RMA77573.1 NusA antitermination factor [Metamycoplasma subdolum]WPB50367.1 transcription termination factor NusA [Metamycoplasma subdolum]